MVQVVKPEPTDATPGCNAAFGSPGKSEAEGILDLFISPRFRKICVQALTAFSWARSNCRAQQSDGSCATANRLKDEMERR